MQVLMLLRNAVSECAKVITFGAQKQSQSRLRIIETLLTTCDNCESAYSKVLERLLPVKNSLMNSNELPGELRRFAADSETRNFFKPERLCGEIDKILVDLNNNLDPTKYSIDVMRLNAVRQGLHQIGNYDGEIRRQYDDLTRALNDLSNQIEQAPPEEISNLLNYAKNTIVDFENDLSLTVKCMRDTKNTIRANL
jgi:hypothetical protein